MTETSSVLSSLVSDSSQSIVARTDTGRHLSIFTDNGRDQDESSESPSVNGQARTVAAMTTSQQDYARYVAWKKMEGTRLSSHSPLFLSSSPPSLFRLYTSMHIRTQINTHTHTRTHTRPRPYTSRTVRSHTGCEVQDPGGLEFLYS
jgi:hypothetical protein